MQKSKVCLFLSQISPVWQTAWVPRRKHSLTWKLEHCFRKSEESKPTGTNCAWISHPSPSPDEARGFLGCCSSLPCCCWGLNPKLCSWGLSAMLCSGIFIWPAWQGPRASLKEPSHFSVSPWVWRTHRYILHWGHVASVQLGLMRAQPRHQRRETQ